MSFLNIEDKKIIVTGGNSGFGLAIAKELKNNGAKVIVGDLHFSDETKQLFDCYELDISKVNSIRSFFKTMKETYGNIDVVVNNAGISIPGMLIDPNVPYSKYEITEEDYDKCFNINVKGTLFMCQEAARLMFETKTSGKIINMTSTSGNEGSQGQGVYAASKNAISSLTRSFAKELGKYDIKFIAVAPGIYQPTNLTNAAYNERMAYTRGINVEQLYDNYGKGIPLGRVGTHEELGYLLAFLCSDKSDYLDGSLINISGGKTR